MARRKHADATTTPPAADTRPAEAVAASAPTAGNAAQSTPVTETVTIRAGHRHRGVLYAVATPYAATTGEAALLRQYGALVEG